MRLDQINTDPKGIHRGEGSVHRLFRDPVGNIRSVVHENPERCGPKAVRTACGAEYRDYGAISSLGEPSPPEARLPSAGPVPEKAGT